MKNFAKIIDCGAPDSKILRGFEILVRGPCARGLQEFRQVEQDGFDPGRRRRAWAAGLLVIGWFALDTDVAARGRSDG
jgi:hypothetical protein